MRTVPLDGGPLLDAVYHRVLVPSFRPDELDTLSSLRHGLRHGETVGVAVVDATGEPVAAMIGEWAPECRVMLLSYLAVSRAARGGGIGGRLYDEVIGAWRATYRPCLIVAEVEHPDHHEATAAYGDPAARLRFYGRHGARVLNVPYFQPALAPGSARVYGMLLLALHVDPELSGRAPAMVAADPLRAFLTGYWQVEGGVGDDPATAALFAALPAGGDVALLPIGRYRDVPLADARARPSRVRRYGYPQKVGPVYDLGAETTVGERDLTKIVKAYDVRGVVPDQLDESIARAVGTAFVLTLRDFGESADEVVMAYDMRRSSPLLAAAFAEGANAAGANVVDVGLASTDMLYYASGLLGLPGAMFTASHNPAQYGGIKMCRAGAKPIGQDTGLAQIRDRAQALLDGTAQAPGGGGTVTERDLLPDYAAHLRSLVDLRGIRPLTVAVDAGNGMAGYTVPAVLGDTAHPALPLRIVPLYFELDGTFPNHEANPLDPANLVDLQKAVRDSGADIGLAFDGDADRCFVVDADGNPVSPSAITALVAVRELARHPGATIIHNLITSSAVPEIVAEHGGRPVRTRVGHSFIKDEMAATGAAFGGEHSAHYYFADFWGADTGMLAAMHVLAALGEQTKPLSELVAGYSRYVASGEINSEVTDQQAKLREVERVLGAVPGAEVDHLDGLTVRFADGSWANLRPSNTEPLLRLNVEAHDHERMVALRDEVLALVRA